jgi:hypothetical protein
LKAAQTAWEVLASSVSFRIVMMGVCVCVGGGGDPTVFETSFTHHHRHHRHYHHLTDVRFWIFGQDVAPLSLVRLRPHTGLKHQLRVHMARALGGTFGLRSGVLEKLDIAWSFCSADPWGRSVWKRHD